MSNVSKIAQQFEVEEMETRLEFWTCHWGGDEGDTRPYLWKCHTGEDKVPEAP